MRLILWVQICGLMDLTNTTNDKTFVLSKNYALEPGATVTVPDDEYEGEFILRYNINRMVGDGSGEISITGAPVGYPMDDGDPPAETKPRLKPMFQVK